MLRIYHEECRYRVEKDHGNRLYECESVMVLQLSTEPFTFIKQEIVAAHIPKGIKKGKSVKCQDEGLK